MTYFNFCYEDIMDVKSKGVHRFTNENGFSIYLNGKLMFELCGGKKYGE